MKHLGIAVIFIASLYCAQEERWKPILGRHGHRTTGTRNPLVPNDGRRLYSPL